MLASAQWASSTTSDDRAEGGEVLDEGVHRLEDLGPVEALGGFVGRRAVAQPGERGVELAVRELGGDLADLRRASRRTGR